MLLPQNLNTNTPLSFVTNFFSTIKARLALQSPGQQALTQGRAFNWTNFTFFPAPKPQAKLPAPSVPLFTVKHTPQ